MFEARSSRFKSQMAIASLSARGRLTDANPKVLAPDLEVWDETSWNLPGMNPSAEWEKCTSEIVFLKTMNITEYDNNVVEEAVTYIQYAFSENR